MNDDMYPNDPTYFLPTEPQEQRLARSKEKATVLENATILEEMLAHFDVQIAFYDSLDAMPHDLKTDPTKFMNRHNANQLARDFIRQEREYIQGLLDIYAPSR